MRAKTELAWMIISYGAMSTTACCSQVIQEGGLRSDGLPQLAFYLDGAHTQESMSACGHWFADSLLAEQAPTGESMSPVRVHPQQRPRDSHTALGSLSSSSVSQGRMAREAGFQSRRTENIMIFNCMEVRGAERPACMWYPNCQQPCWILILW